MNSFGTVFAHDEIDLGDVGLRARSCARARRVQHLLKSDGRLVRRLSSTRSRLTFCTSMSISSAEGFVRNVSMMRLCSFCAIVASASAGSRKNSESG